jgi:hypothetical protein
MPDSQTVQPAKAVYYPHVEFRSAAWVKSALLYWEGIMRARPEQAAPQDDAEIQELLDAGLVEEIAPDPVRRRALPEIAPRFEELLRARGGRLPTAIPGITGLRGASPEREERVRAEIVEAFREYPLSRKAFLEQSDQGRVLLFTIWADIFARERKCAPVTDDPIFDAISTYLANEKITDDPNRLTPATGHAVGQLCLPTPSLEAIAQLPVARLLEIRKRYAAQRQHFRDKVQAQLTAIAEQPTPEAIEEQLKRFKADIHDDFDAAREAVKDANVKERWTWLGIGAQVSLTAGVSLAAATPVLGAIEGIGTLAFGVTNWFVKKQKTIGTQRSRYLLSVDTALKNPGRSLTQAFRRLVEE